MPGADLGRGDGAPGTATAQGAAGPPLGTLPIHTSIRIERYSVAALQQFPAAHASSMAAPHFPAVAMSLFRPLLSILAASALAACATSAPTSAPGVPEKVVTSAYNGDAARPAEGIGWVRTELYFATGQWVASPEETAASEQRWLDFLDREVTPRFPKGLSVIDVYGQWLPPGASTPSRLRSKELVVHHPDTPEQAAAIEAIRTAWKQETGHLSVLRSQLHADVSF